MQRLRELRLEKGLTQQELGEKISLTQTTIGKYERGELEPSIDILERLASFFQCSIDFLIGFSDDFGNISIYRTENASALSGDEQKIIDVLRESAPFNPVEWVSLYASLPAYMQESIFAELKGMHLGFKAASKKKNAN